MPSLLLVVTVCLAEVLTMVGTFTFSALLPSFINEWQLTNIQAGWLSGIMLGGYAISVPALVGLTDRYDAKLVYLCGAALAAISFAAFALIAEGFWSALILRAVSGIALAATYMPGLRMLVDRINTQKSTRGVAIYTASFSLGTAFSFFISGEIGVAFSWEVAFIIASVCAAVAFILVLMTLVPVIPPEPNEKTALLDFRPIFKNRAVMGYILAYGVHSWELFAYRSWLVAFLVFSLSLQTETSIWPAPTIIASLTAVIAVFASIGGNELAERFGRRRMIYLFLILAGSLGLFSGLLAATPYWFVSLIMLLYAALIQLDSAALTAGTVTSAEKGRKGTTLGLHSLIGFSGAAAGPIVVGLVLDLGGGINSLGAWGLGFASMGFVALLGPIGLWWYREK
ncbi:MFS transporter [Rhodospirillales bacterium]|nr:MFS transporter [Rhodospirillales bacterium]